MDKNEKKDLLDDKQLDEVSGAKIPPKCTDGGKHEWGDKTPGDLYRTCVKCGASALVRI